MRDLAVLAFLASSFGVLFAQTATLRGTVTDQSGAIIGNAKVSLKNTAKGWTRTASTSKSIDLGTPPATAGDGDSGTPDCAHGAFFAPELG